MNILYVVQYYPPHTGGLEKVAQKQAQSAAAAGHKVTMVTFALPHAKTGVTQEGDITVHRVKGNHFFDTKFGVPFCIGGIHLLRTMAREVRQADVVHIHDVFYVTSLVAYIAARWYKKPMMLTQHVAMVAHTSKLIMLAEKVVYGLWGRRIFRASKHIITYQKVVTDFLLTQGVEKRRLVEVRNGVEVDLFRPISDAEKKERREKLGLPVEKKLVLFVGRLVPKKGYRELFEARDPAYDIVFVGPGDIPDAWRMEEGVHFLGSKTQEEVSYLFPAVDVCAAPSVGEMFTLVMQEAMASGLPLVITDAPEYEAYALDRDRITLCESTSKALKSNLTRIATDTAVRADMGAYARKLAEDMFDWNKNVQPTLDLYTDLTPQIRARVVVTTSWDDGHVLDRKLAHLLEKYGVNGTFYIAPHDHELAAKERLSDGQVRELAEHFEIGAHTLTHRHLITLDDAEARAEIFGSKNYLEKVTGKPVTSFCYPAGKYCRRHTNMVQEAGFQCARTVRRFALRKGNKPYELPTSVHTYDHWLDVWGLLKFVRCNPFAFFTLYRHWDRQAIAMFDRVLERGGVFHLWGHSAEVERHDDWDRLKCVLQHMGGRKNVSYVTNSELI